LEEEDEYRRRRRRRRRRSAGCYPRAVTKGDTREKPVITGKEDAHKLTQNIQHRTSYSLQSRPKWSPYDRN
jgi:hypothetical protein